MKRAKSITSSKRIIQVNDNLLGVEYHTIYSKDDTGKELDFKRRCAKFNEKVNKRAGWIKLPLQRPLSTIVSLPNNCEDWVYTVPYVRYSIKKVSSGC